MAGRPSSRARDVRRPPRQLDGRQPAARRDQLGQHAGAGAALAVVDVGARVLRRARRRPRPRDSPPLDAHPWLVDLLLGLDRQLQLVEQNLSTYFSPNTHLLGEALALYVAGRHAARAAPGAGARRARPPRPDRGDGAPDLSGRRPRRAIVPLSPLHAGLLPAGAGGGAADRRRPAPVRRSGAPAWPVSRASSPTIADTWRASATTTAASCSRSAAATAPTPAIRWRWPPACSAIRRSPWAPRPRKRCGCRDRGAIADSRPHGGRDPVDDARRQRLHRLPHRARRPPGVRHRAARLPERRPRPRRRAVHHADRVGPALARRSRHGLLHHRCGAPRSLPLDAPAQHAGPRRARTVGARRPVPLGAHDRRLAPDMAHVAVARLCRRRTRRLRAAGSPPRRALRPGCWIVADRVLGEGDHQAEVHWHLDPRWTVANGGNGWLRADDGNGDPVWIRSLEGEFAILRGSEAGGEPDWAGLHRRMATSGPAPRCGWSTAARRRSRW